MEEIECDDFDFDVDRDITNDSDVPPIKSGVKDKDVTNNNHVTSETVLLSDSDEESITINDEEETAKNCDVRCVTINNIVVNCISINSGTENVDVQRNVADGREKKTRKELHSLHTQNKRQRRHKQEQCITINDDENDGVIDNDSDDPKRKIQKQKNNNVELVSFNSIGKLVTLEDDKDTKCVTPNGENIPVKVVTFNDPINLVTLVNNEVCVNSKNDHVDLNDNDQQYDNGDTTEKFFEVPLIDKCEETVVKVGNISITIEKCIDNEVEKCINKQFNEECMVKTEKDNSDEDALNNGYSVNLYDSEFTIEEGFVKNVYKNNDNAVNNESSSQFECAHKSPDLDGLLEHLETHPFLKNLRCSMCKYKCKNKFTLEAHVMERHTKVKPLSCPFCPYRCLEECWLEKHLEIHKNKGHRRRTFQCDKCEKVLYSIHAFHKHLDKCSLYALM